MAGAGDFNVCRLCDYGRNNDYRNGSICRLALNISALLPLPLLAVTSRVLGSKLHDAFRDSQVAFFQRLMIKTQESITGIKVIKTFGQEKKKILLIFTEKN
ncbi:hypothetical protein JG559_13060 [Enterococcus faecalis]|uniref:Uncharacterized protein n=1 Tax=Enterococcus faecalis TaxID=1351 RepID=A0A974NYP6_ENTFL|nr:hypothetical protein JG559_13060 [Enterococcus faecalis]